MRRTADTAEDAVRFPGTDASEHDAAALRIAERIRSSLDLEDVLQYTVDELGRALGVSRSLVQLTPGDDGVSLMLEWNRGDTLPLDVRPPTPVARRVLATHEPLVVERSGEAEPEIRSYLLDVASESVVAIPVLWRGRSIAALALEDSRPRAWREALPLLRRLDGQVGAAIAQADLVRQQLAALEQLENLNRLREELIANVSHELRTPLAAIAGVVATLLREDIHVDAAKQRQLLRTAAEQTERLTLVAGDLLELARFSRGAHVLRREPVHLGSIVELARAGVVVPEGRTFAVRLEDDPVLFVDRHRIAQVLSNLLVNAVRHGQGVITLRARAEASCAVVSLSDEGGGLARGKEDEMFMPFTHSSSRSDSTGLGLSIARAIAEAHGGSLGYRPGVGAAPHEFVLRLPLGPPERRPASTAARRSGGPSGSRSTNSCGAAPTPGR